MRDFCVSRLQDGLVIGEKCAGCQQESSNKSLLVSILVLCYNNFQHLTQTIDSILTQDYRNIELIISDDGSDEFDVDEIESYIYQSQKAIAKIAINVNSVNVGTVKHCEYLVSYATGDIVLMLAGDDVLASETVISSVVDEFNRLGHACSVVTTQIEMWNCTLSERQALFLNPEDIELLQSEDSAAVFSRLAKSCFIAAPGTFYRKEVLQQNPLPSSRYWLIEDYPLYCQLARKGIIFHYLDVISARHRAGGVSQSSENRDIQRKFLCDKLLVLATECFPYYEDMPPSFLDNLLANFDHALGMLCSCSSECSHSCANDELRALLLMEAVHHQWKDRIMIEKYNNERHRRILAENKIEKIHETFSWRITKPLRRVKKLFKRSL